MNIKQLLFYVIAFIIGLIIGKTVKLNIKTRGCPIAQSKLEEIKRRLNSDSSEDYI